MKEDEGAARGDACRVFGEVVHIGLLTAYDAVGKVDDTMHGEVITRFEVVNRACGFELEVEGFGEVVVFAWCSHGADAYACEFEHPGT